MLDRNDNNESKHRSGKYQSIHEQEFKNSIIKLKKEFSNCVYKIPLMSKWLDQNKHLYELSKVESKKFSCYEDFSCGCVLDSTEYKYSNFFEILLEVRELFQYEGFFKKQMELRRKINNNSSSIEKWLKSNEYYGQEKFLLFWIEWLEEDYSIVRPWKAEWDDWKVEFSYLEWNYTILFLKEFYNQLYNSKTT